uniref:Uncharacterized protein n=1 Tax=Anguilla anguilla TaxID=7936 RepID=A0A0E9QW05_ANGAN
MQTVGELLSKDITKDYLFLWH